MNFEENSKKLESIVAQLESGKVTLEEGSKLFEEGVKLAKECYSILQEQKGKITKIKQDQNAFFEEELN